MMAKQQQIQDELKAQCICPVWQECTNLAALPDCGHTICVICLLKLSPPACPSCRETIRLKPKSVIHALKSILNLVKQEEDDKRQEDSTDTCPFQWPPLEDGGIWRMGLSAIRSATKLRRHKKGGNARPPTIYMSPIRSSSRTFHGFFI